MGGLSSSTSLSSLSTHSSSKTSPVASPRESGRKTEARATLLPPISSSARATTTEESSSSKKSAANALSPAPLTVRSSSSPALDRTRSDRLTRPEMDVQEEKSVQSVQLSRESEEEEIAVVEKESSKSEAKDQVDEKVQI